MCQGILERPGARYRKEKGVLKRKGNFQRRLPKGDRQVIAITLAAQTFCKKVQYGELLHVCLDRPQYGPVGVAEALVVKEK